MKGVGKGNGREVEIKDTKGLKKMKKEDEELTRKESLLNFNVFFYISMNIRYKSNSSLLG
jgi:hypothetical protein